MHDISLQCFCVICTYLFHLSPCKVCLFASQKESDAFASSMGWVSLTSNVSAYIGMSFKVNGPNVF